MWVALEPVRCLSRTKEGEVFHIISLKKFNSGSINSRKLITACRTGFSVQVILTEKMQIDRQLTPPT